MRRIGRQLEFVESPLDPADELLGQEPGPAGSRPRRWRDLLDWSASSAPVALLLLTGIAVGPGGANLLSEAVLSALAPIVPVSVAGLGVLVGLNLGEQRPDDRRVFVAAGLGAVTAMAVVSGGFASFVRFAALPPAVESWALIASLGICAAPSLTLPAGNPLDPRSVPARLAGLGVVVPIVAGGLLLARLRSGSAAEALSLLAQVSVITLALAGAAWLLLTRVSSVTEERVIALSALLLVGGVGEALSLSSLFSGLIAGAFWRYAGGPSRDSVGRDVLFVQHPLLVIVLLVAGARADLSPPLLALGLAYLVLRIAGQLAGGIVAGRVAQVDVHRDLVPRLLLPGVFGVAFALNLDGAGSAEAPTLLAVVVAGTIASELVAPIVSAWSAGE
jgi:hypothetical protein